MKNYHNCTVHSGLWLQVDTLETGEIDYEQFRTRLRKNVAKPAIVNVNVGTTVKGAVDNLDKILEALQDAGYSEDRFFIHCDGALFGLMVRTVCDRACITSLPPSECCAALPLDRCAARIDGADGRLMSLS